VEIALVRVVLVGWQHPFYTAFTGLGFAFARQAENTTLRVVFPFLGWSFAVAFHTLHNLFAVLSSNVGRTSRLNLIWDWSGYLGLLFLIILLIKREGSCMKIYLAPEKESGLIDSRQYQIACSAWRQGFVFFRSLFNGKLLETRRFYQACGDLMHKLRQANRYGDESYVIQEIEHLRTELSALGKAI
jgi:hypothetical protein